MKASGILLIICICLQNAFSQFYENFDDGDFIYNPKWLGDTSFFIVNDSNQLQSQGPALSSEIYLSTEFEMEQNTIWEFYAKLNFSSSSSNYARFYLSADKAELASDLKGYYVRIGGESGAQDGVDLYFQDGSVHSKIIDGIPGFIGKDSNEVQVKVSRSYNGLWSVWADTSANNLILQGNVLDNTISLSKHFGAFCKHSSTRSDKFFFDNISIQDGLFDLLECKALNDTTLEVQFSNPLDSISARLVNNYSINNAISNPKSTYSIDSFPNSIHLNLNSKMIAGEYSLTVSNILDRNNQQLITDTISFNYFPQAQVSKLIINEIMFDPNPTVGLPASEYVELLNISNSAINLEDLRYSDSNTEFIFPEILLDSGDYLILCDIEDTAIFKWSGNVIGLETWPALNNSGDVLSILSNEGQIIDQISYDEHWFDGSAKDEGGWSFERINPFKKCSNKDNWAYSINGAGGTPGEINSIFNPRPDLEGPEIIYSEILSSRNIRIVFDEILQQNQTLFAHFQPSNQIESFLINENLLEIVLTTDLDSGMINTITIDSILDCEGNLSLELNGIFGLGQKPEIFDLIITEIMYDPEPQNFLPASEYFEILNNSGKIISLNSILAISGNDSSELPSISIYPDEYLILCPSSKFDELSSFGNAVKLSPWTSLSNDEDEIRLSINSDIIHKVNYSSNWISDAEKSEGGWSIEMIDPDNPCAEDYNWNASIDQRGGTPGEVNSLFSQNLDLKPAQITNLDILTNKSIKVFFNEQVDLFNLHLNNIQIEPDNEVTDFYSENRLTKSLLLNLSEELQPDIEYELHLNQFKDCMHNFSDLYIAFILPEKPENQDIAINEVLFNPPTGVSEFIEIYNQTSKKINLENTLIRYYASDGQLRSNTLLSDNDIILNAFEFLVLCEDSNSIIEYFPRHGINYLEISGFPSLNNESGTIVILDSNFLAIDSIAYSEDFHFELIEDEKGVSLERLSTDISGLQNDNWTSASETYHFASPGIPNSKSIERVTAEEQVNVEPSLFSPDGDGYKDLLHIQFNTDNPNAIVSINIFDQNGRLVKNLANNFTLSYGNDFIWDGITDLGEKARIGNYIILVDIFDVNGNRNKIKKVVGLGGRI